VGVPRVLRIEVAGRDEQVTLLEDTGEVEVDGAVTPLRPYDSTYIQGGIDHAIRNTGPARSARRSRTSSAPRARHDRRHRG